MRTSLHALTSLLFPGLAVLGVLLGLAVLGATGERVAAQTGETLVFVIRGLRVDTGTVRGGIYASRELWTAVGGQVGVCTSRVSHGESRCVVHAPGPGRYGFAFYHDADDDNQLDRDMLGVPQEGYGFSNNVRPGLGAPAFDAAAFDVTAGQTYTTRITALYGWSL